MAAKFIENDDGIALAKLEKARDAYNRNLGARRSKIVNRAIQRAKFQEAQ